MTLMAKNSQAKAPICLTCYGEGKVFTFGRPSGERATRTIWVSCPTCQRPPRVVAGP